jgi:hypothetical protein
VRIIGDFGHFSSGFGRLWPKRVDTFPAKENPGKTKNFNDFLECSPQNSFWLACPGSHAKNLQEAWKHKQMIEGNFHGFSGFCSVFAGNFRRSSGP